MANSILCILFCNDITKTIIHYYLPLLKCYTYNQSKEFSVLSISFNKVYSYEDLEIIVAKINDLLKLDFYANGSMHYITITKTVDTNRIPSNDVLRNLLAQFDSAFVYSIYVFNEIYNNEYDQSEDEKFEDWIV